MTTRSWLSRARSAPQEQVAAYLHRSLGAIVEALALAPSSGDYLAEFARCARGSRLVSPLPPALVQLIGRALEHGADRS